MSLFLDSFNLPCSIIMTNSIQIFSPQDPKTREVNSYLIIIYYVFYFSSFFSFILIHILQLIAMNLREVKQFLIDFTSKSRKFQIVR